MPDKVGVRLWWEDEVAPPNGLEGAGGGDLGLHSHLALGMGGLGHVVRIGLAPQVAGVRIALGFRYRV